MERVLNDRGSLDNIIGQIILGLKPPTPFTNVQDFIQRKQAARFKSYREHQQLKFCEVIHDYNNPSNADRLRTGKKPKPSPSVRSDSKRNKLIPFLSTMKQPLAP